MRGMNEASAVLLIVETTQAVYAGDYMDVSYAWGAKPKDVFLLLQYGKHSSRIPISKTVARLVKGDTSPKPHLMDLLLDVHERVIRKVIYQ